MPDEDFGISRNKKIENKFKYCDVKTHKNALFVSFHCAKDTNRYDDVIPQGLGRVDAWRGPTGAVTCVIKIT